MGKGAESRMGRATIRDFCRLFFNYLTKKVLYKGRILCYNVTDTFCCVIRRAAFKDVSQYLKTEL